MADRSSAESQSARETYLEQYKAYLADLGNVGSRYATVSGFYVSVISALLGILAVAESSKLFGKLETATLIVVCAFASCLCIVWSGIIRFYGALFRAKLTVLSRLEEHLSYPCFKEEFATLKGSNVRFLTEWERYVPLILILFFVVLAAIRVIG